MVLKRQRQVASEGAWLWRVRRVVVTALVVVVGAGWMLATTSDRSGGQTTSDAPLIDWSGDQLEPSVAFNAHATVNGYLTVWEDHHWGVNGPDIYARWMDVAGTPLADRFSVAYAGTEAKSVPDVACDPTYGECFVVWQQASSIADHEVYGVRVGSGGVIGSPIGLANGTIWEGEPAVAADARLYGRYVAVWSEEMGSGEFVHRNVVGHTIHADGSLAGVTALIAVGSVDERAPDVACCSTDDHWLVVWQQRSSTDSSWDVYARVFDRDGWAVNSASVVTSASGDQITPRVAYDGMTNTYLVVWEDVGSLSRISGRFLAADGALLGTEINLSGWPAHRPAVAATGGEWVVTYEDEAASSGLSERLQYTTVNLAGQHLESGYIETDTADSRRPDLASGAEERWVAVWQDERNSVSSGWDVHRHLHQGPTATPTPTGTLQPTPTPTPTWTPTPTPVPSLDLSVEHVEITQAIQCRDNPSCVDNSVPMIRGKTMYVRVSVEVTGAATVPGVEATATVLSDGAVIPMTPMNSSITPPVTELRDRFDHTLNFALNRWAVTASGSVQVEVNPAHTIAETNYANNTATVPFQMVEAAPLEIAPVLVEFTIGGKKTVLPSLMPWYMSGYTENILPVPEVQLIQPPGPPMNWKTPLGPGADDGWRNLLNAVKDRRQKSSSNYWSAHFAGMFPKEVVVGSIIGYGKLPGRAVVLVAPRVHSDLEDGANILVHELGHNFKRWHAPCGNPGDVDSGYPHANALIGDSGWDPHGAGGGGTQLLPWAWIVPSVSRYDVMSYCSDDWISAYNYTAILDWRGNTPLRGNPPVASELLPYLFASGAIEGQTVTLDPWTILERDDIPDQGTGSGSWSLQLVDGGGSVLTERWFEPEEAVASHGDGVSEGESGSVMSFYELVPWESSTTAVRILEGEEVRAERQVSDAPPTVELLAPTGGEHWEHDGEHVIAWNAGDDDGDQVWSDVFYSDDDGVSWEPVATRLTESCVQVTGAQFPGSDSARIKVVASDGLLATAVVSEPFSVDRTPPQVVIVAPFDHAAVPPDTPVLLKAIAADREDGSLPDGALSWHSDLDGALGDGRSVLIPALSEGIHAVTVSAIDDDGDEASDTIVVVCRNCGLGDVDCNGELLPSDVVALAGHLFGTRAVRPDSDQDGEITGADLAEEIRIVLGAR